MCCNTAVNGSKVEVVNQTEDRIGLADKIVRIVDYRLCPFMCLILGVLCLFLMFKFDSDGKNKLKKSARITAIIIFSISFIQFVLVEGRIWRKLYVNKKIQS